MRFVIVTGMSGAGKTSVLKFLEDVNFFCVDNLPPALIPKFAELCDQQNGDFDSIAIGVDIRGGKLFDDLSEVLETLEKNKFTYEILFLEATDGTLIKRYKETRRSHPLSKGGSVEDGIHLERKKLENVRLKANHILNTSNFLTRELKEQINHMFLENKKFDNLMVKICSFGFKYGIPPDSDLVFDVRFLPNPFYLPELKYLTGNDEAVNDYVMSFQEGKDFLEKLVDMMNFLLPQYIKEGKSDLVISIGCTGGKHRSVTLANALYQALQSEERLVLLKHNDIEKDARNRLK